MNMKNLISTQLGFYFIFLQGRKMKQSTCCISLQASSSMLFAGIQLVKMRFESNISSICVLYGCWLPIKRRIFPRHFDVWFLCLAELSLFYCCDLFSCWKQKILAWSIFWATMFHSLHPCAYMLPDTRIIYLDYVYLCTVCKVLKILRLGLSSQVSSRFNCFTWKLIELDWFTCTCFQTITCVTWTRH